MKITPLDIRRKEFKRALRGYSDEEVDVFLDEVADEFERIFQENAELQERVHRLEEQLAGHNQLREALEKTLIQAQLQSDEIRANAHKESELILRDAQMKARAIINESYAETQKVQQTLAQLKRLEEEFRFKFRSLLEGYLRLLKEAELTTPEQAVAVETSSSSSSSSVEAASRAEAVPALEVMSVAEAPAAEVPSTLAEAPAAEVPSTGPEVLAGEAAIPSADEVPTEEATVEEQAGVETEKEGEDEQLEGERVETFFLGKRAEYPEFAPADEDAGKKGTGRDFEW